MDDTLYPPSSGVWQAIAERILGFMKERYGIPLEEARLLRRRYFEAYGTTFNGLRIHFDVDPVDYMDYVHNLPLDKFLEPSPQLHQMLSRVIQKRVIFTNASSDYARRVLDRLGIADVIDQIVDIFALSLVNKPEPEAYIRALSLVGEANPRACVVVDDMVRNLLPAASLGMTTVLVGDDDAGHVAHHRIKSILDLPEVLPELFTPST